MTFWADEVAQSLDPSIRHTVHDSKTPSGTVPVSGLRGPVISDAIARAARAAGRRVRFLYGIDDMDPMDSQSMRSQEGMAEQMGRPLCNIPTPDPSVGADYADYHAKRFLSTFADLGIRPEIYRMRDVYADGRMDPQIELVLRRADLVRQVYRDVAKVQRDEDWLPVQIVCEQCGRVGTTYATDFDGKTVAYECLPDRSRFGRGDDVAQWAQGCGRRARVSPFGGRAKLPWNLEWCAQWALFDVTYEEAGKDLMTAGGSRERSNALFRAVWEKEPPPGLFHEFLNLGGKKMSSSKGIGAAAHDLVGAYPGELIRFLMLRTRPQTAIEFDPAGTSLPRLMDEYDRCADAFAERPDDELGRVWALSQLGDATEALGFRVRFSVLASWLQIPSIDPLREAAKLKGSPLAEREERDLRRRIDLARVWLERWAPDDAKFGVAKELPALALSDLQRAYLREVLTLVGAVTDPELMQEQLYEAAKRVGLVTPEGKPSRDAFAALYSAFIGKPNGPRAGWLLTTLYEKDAPFVRTRLEEAAKA